MAKTPPPRVPPAPQPGQPLGASLRSSPRKANGAHTRRSYDRSLTDFLAWYAAQPDHPGFTKAAVQRYVRHLEQQNLAASTINVRLTPVRRLAAEAADNGLFAPELAAAIARVQGVRQHGARTGNWLTAAQTERLLNAPDRTTLKGKRDRALLAVLIGCGLRRSEASALRFEDVQQRDGRWAIVDLRGKGKRIRTVPMPPWTKVAIDHWAAAAGIASGPVFRSLNNRHKLTGGALPPQNILDAVVRYGRRIGVAQLAPHDLRRTFAKLAHQGRASLEQIQLSLGHASVVTTERYLGVRQNLQHAPCDHLGLRVA